LLVNLAVFLGGLECQKPPTTKDPTERPKEPILWHFTEQPNGTTTRNIRTRIFRNDRTAHETNNRTAHQRNDQHKFKRRFKQMKRRICTSCKSKKRVENMYLVHYFLLARSTFVCKKCYENAPYIFSMKDIAEHILKKSPLGDNESKSIQDKTDE